jgi:hypothetical protein
MGVASTASPASLARFPANLFLPECTQDWVAEGREAVKSEYRSSVKWKRLRCRNAAPLGGQADGSIFVLEVGHSIEFDWTWEGAIAFRPVDVNGFNGDIDGMDDFISTLSEQPARASVWSGEVVEVDQTNGKIYVSVSTPENPPCCGSFYIRPFEFLAFLHSIYEQSDFAAIRQLLGARLNACRGNIHPAVPSPADVGLAELKGLWKHSWGILWGPPGTGKTYTLAKQVASCLSDPSERILVISTTNRATDAAAIAIGRSMEKRPLEAAQALRIGNGAGYARYQACGLEGMLRGTETELLHQLSLLLNNLHQATCPDERAVLQSNIQALRRCMKDSAFNIFTSPDVRVVIGTALKVTALLVNPTVRALLAAGEAPFTTVVIDEAGLLSRATTAVLSLLAARRVLVVGDSKQLAPISRVSRILPTSQSTWLASSPLSHLHQANQVRPGVYLLSEQHRMHPEVSRTVSEFQYDGQLRDASAVLERSYNLPPLLHGQPRAIWYVLDEDADNLPSIRAARGSGNRSWLRPGTRSVLEKLLSDPLVQQMQGIFVTPFAAQARDIARFFAEGRFDHWTAATVHSQQGAEADLVIFDTVNAGSCGWPYDEWKRLINVGLSRAKEFVILLSSRAEMNEPYLGPLLKTLAPRILAKSGKSYAWKEVPAKGIFEPPPEIAANPNLLGSQLEARKRLRPVMSTEQQRLCGGKVGGGPRLVRGVAGSGKTAVLAHWLQKTVNELAGRPDSKVWGVYANRSLARLITNTIVEAWTTENTGQPFPWDNRVALHHIKDILDSLLPQVGLFMKEFQFDYDKASEEYLKRRPVEQIKPCCHALFIDEAQDMGPNTLKLLSALVELADPNDPNSRSINIFYDNAQNVYGRSTPKWSEIGLNLKGRSTVMKESFRSTMPITEFALNVLYTFQPPESDADHKELVERGLVERCQRNGMEWWHVRFNQVGGPLPVYKRYASLDQQVRAIAEQVFRWVKEDGVRPRDICILSNDKCHGQRIAGETTELLKRISAKAVFQSGQAFNLQDNSVIVSTPQSFKGYDAEIVVIGGVERFIAKNKILANNLYVAMTRARSILALYAYDKKGTSPEATRILSTINKCLDTLLHCPKVEEISRLDEFEDVLERIGSSHRDWLSGLWKSRRIEIEPLVKKDGEILSEPLFWFKEDDRIVACFDEVSPGISAEQKLEDAGIQLIRPGENWIGE